MRATNRIFIGSILVLFVSTLGPALRTVNWPYPLTGLWPVAGLWAAIAWSGGYMSVRAALALVFLGLYQDFLHEALRKSLSNPTLLETADQLMIPLLYSGDVIISINFFCPIRDRTEYITHDPPYPCDSYHKVLLGG